MTWGPDYASVDGNGPPDFATLRAAGCAFVGLRASYAWGDRQGAWHVVPDTTFARDWTRGSVFPRIAYLFPVVQAKASPEDQVRTFCDAVTHAGGLRPGLDFPPALDIEFPGAGIATTGLSRDGVTAWIRRAITELHARFRCWPVLYTSGRVWGGSDADCLGDPPAPDLAECPLWLARYPYKTRVSAVLPPPGTLTDPPVPRPWAGAWALHQYQGDALGCPGMTATVDLSRFHELRAGSAGGSVAWVQRRLGAGLVADGTMGPVTVAALRAATGSEVVDVRTFCVLAWR